MRGRPLCGLTIAFAGGIATAYRLPSGSLGTLSLPILAAVFVLLLAAGLFIRAFRHLTIVLITFGVLGILAGYSTRPPSSPPRNLKPFINDPAILVVAEVAQSPDFHSDRIQLPLQLEQIITPEGRFSTEAGVLLSLGQVDRQEPGEWVAGDRMMAHITLKSFHNFNNPGGYDYVSRQAERGFHAKAYAASSNSLVKLARPAPESFPHMGWLLKRLDRFRQRALFWLEANEAPDVAAFHAALLLGYRHLLSRSWIEHLNRSGVTHLLAISGLHLGMVSIAIYWLTSRLIRLFLPSLLQRTSDRRIALWGAFFCALLYAFVGGLALPTWRAAIMLLLVCMAVFNYRKPDVPSLLAAAAMVILLSSPAVIGRVSFQLSFAALIGIFLLSPRFERVRALLFPFGQDRIPLIHKVAKPFWDAFLLSAAVSVTTFPLIAYHFNGFSLSGIAANTLLVPWIGFLVLPMGLLTLATFAVNESVATVLLKAGGWAVSWAQHVILWFSGQSWSLIWVGLVPIVCVLAFYAAIALLLVPWRWRYKVASLLVLASALLVYEILDTVSLAGHADRSLHVTAIDVGQGSSTLVQFPGGQTMLVDGGGFFDDSFDVGRYVLAPFLWQSGIHKLDYVVLSHDHPDHRNGLRFILSHFNVEHFWQTGFTGTKEGENIDEFQALAKNHSTQVLQLPGVLVPQTLGSCKIKILHPSLPYIEDIWNGEDFNNISLVLAIEFGETSVIVPGDIDSSVERLLFEEYKTGGDLLLISPHHGSGRSNSDLLLERLEPKNIIFSCGHNNWFGFPAPEVLQRCRSRRIRIHRTDSHGAIMASSDGFQWKIQRYIEQQKRTTREQLPALEVCAPTAF